MLEYKLLPYLVYGVTMPVVIEIIAAILIILVIIQYYVHKKFPKNSIFREPSNTGTALYALSLLLTVVNSNIFCARRLVNSRIIQKFHILTAKIT